LVVFIGVTEVLALAGLVVPMVTVMAPLADATTALGLAIIVAHGLRVPPARRRTHHARDGLWAGIAGVIAIGRWDLLVASHTYVAPWSWLPLWECWCLRSSSISLCSSVVLLTEAPDSSLRASCF